jgi:ABC-2 type transport system permease protein
MRWKNAFILMRKDLDEFKKQKLVIGSIIAMPLVLGVVIPLVIFVPLTTFGPLDESFDIDGIVEIGDLEEIHINPQTNQTFENISIYSEIILNKSIENARLEDVILISSIVNNSIISDSTIRDSLIMNSTLNNVVVNHSEGIRIKGENIVVVDSKFEFINESNFDLENIMPMMLNMVLMMFIIIPATLPTIIASYSIVGEKNNRTLEPLLATPTTDGEILAGKVLSSFVPTMGATIGAFVLGIILLDIVFYTQMGTIPLPNLIWILSIVLLAPTACLMSILALVLISSKVTDVRAAQQVGGFVIMPVIVLMLGVMGGVILLLPIMVVFIAIIFACIDLGLFYFAKAIFNREDILVKWA